MSTERIIAALNAIAQRVEHEAGCPAPRDCHAIYGGYDLDFRCECNWEARVLAAQGDAIHAALEMGIANAGGVAVHMGYNSAVRELERASRSGGAGEPK